MLCSCLWLVGAIVLDVAVNIKVVCVDFMRIRGLFVVFVLFVRTRGLFCCVCAYG